MWPLTFEPQPPCHWRVQHLIYSPLLCTGIVLRKGNGKNNLGTSSIFHEFSFRPEPPLTLVDRSSCCHIFTTWGYSCYLWRLPLTQAAAQAATVCEDLCAPSHTEHRAGLEALKPYLHQPLGGSLGGPLGKLCVHFSSGRALAGGPCSSAF